MASTIWFSLSTPQASLDELRHQVGELRGKEAHLTARLAAWRRQAGREMTEARQRLEAVEASLDHLEQQAEKEDEEDTDRQGFGFGFEFNQGVSGSGSGSGSRRAKNDPQSKTKIKKFYLFLKCWMFSFES